MAGDSGPVGPYPAGVETPEQQDEYDRLRRRVLWTLPYGLYIVGSHFEDRTNGMTLNWATQLSFDPKLIGIGVEKPAVTHELIERSGVFTLCTVARADRAIIRKFTKPVDVDRSAMTLNGFGFHDGVTGAPILDQSVAYLECEVREAPSYGNHTFFVGEVVASGFLQAEDTEVLRMEDTRMNYGG